MKQPDSPKFPTRRILLQAGIAAAGLLANPFAALAAAPPGFDQWRDNFRARALAKGIADLLHEPDFEERYPWGACPTRQLCDAQNYFCQITGSGDCEQLCD